MPFASNQPFSITQVKNTDDWELNVDMVYYGSKYTDNPITIKAGVRHNGSSIPRIVWPMFGHPLSGANGMIGFLHDDICEKKILHRKTCDLIFLEAHKDWGTSFFKRHIMYRAVRFNSIVKGYE